MLYIDTTVVTVRFGGEATPSEDDKMYPKNLEAMKDESDLIWIRDETWTENVLNSYQVQNVTLNGVVYTTAAELVREFNLLML